MGAGYLSETIAAVRAVDDARDRIQQATIGMSELGGCRAALGYRLRGDWPSDRPDTWAAIRGTALHEHVFAARAAHHPHLLHEVEVEWAGVTGHVDEYDPVLEEVTDLKTTKLGTLLAWRRDPDALLSKRQQVQSYARALVESGLRVRRVRVLVAPVDGSFDDWWEHVEDYDPAVSDQSVARLREVQATVAAGEHPPRDMPWSWCQDWCEWFTLCRTGGPVDEPITDPELASAVAGYGEAAAAEGAAKKAKAAYAGLVRGLRGTTGDGWRVTMTQPSGTKDVLDEDAVRATYEASGLPLPYRQVPTSAPSVRVTKAKG